MNFNILIGVFRCLSDLLFFGVLALFSLYIASDVFGLFMLGRDFGQMLAVVVLMGVPLSFVASVVLLLVYGRFYKWYFLVSGLELLVVALVVFIVYGSGI